MRWAAIEAYIVLKWFQASKHAMAMRPWTVSDNNVALHATVKNVPVPFVWSDGCWRLRTSQGAAPVARGSVSDVLPSSERACS